MRHDRTILKIARYLTLTALLIVSIACQHSLSNSPESAPAISATRNSEGIVAASPTPTQADSPQSTVTIDNPAQLVDLSRLNPSIRLDIRYATSNNFLHRPLYSQARCLLRASVAERLSQVQADLEQQKLGLKVYDCYRPLSVQKQMWKLVPDDRFVANPAYGSRHNRGSAVDVTLVNQTGQELEMPTEFDDFTEKSYSDSSKATLPAQKHRQQLKAAMVRHGFIPLKTEWWHFDAPDWQQFPVVDVPLHTIPN